MRWKAASLHPFAHGVEDLVQGLRIWDFAVWERFSVEPSLDVSAQPAIHHPWIKGVALSIEELSRRQSLLAKAQPCFRGAQDASPLAQVGEARSDPGPLLLHPDSRLKE